jgi:hypothetical protein
MFSIITFNIMTLCILASCIMTLSYMAFDIIILSAMEEQFNYKYSFIRLVTDSLFYIQRMMP